MRPRTMLVLVAALTGATPFNGLAARQQDPAPEAVADSFLVAVAAGRWLDAAALHHPTTLAFYRSRLVASLRCAPSRVPLTVEQYLAHNPGTPREVAEHEVARNNRELEETERSNRLEDRFPGVESLDALEALPPEWILARELEAGYGWRADRDLLFDETPRVLGYVREGEWAHVLYRFTYEDAGDASEEVGLYRGPPRILMLRWSEHGWRVGSLSPAGGGTYLMGPRTLEAIGRDPCEARSP